MSDLPPRIMRDYLYDALNQLGIRQIFGVPGTNEIPIIDGTSYPENNVEYVECLHENIAMGAAMGAARMTGEPGVLVVHITPGIAHGIGNLFNAYRSHTPLVILCCQQQNELVTQEPLLSSNIAELAKQYCKWSHELRTPYEFPMVLQRAFKEAKAPACGPVFISIPWEFMMVSPLPNQPQKLPGITRIPTNFTGDTDEIQRLAQRFSEAKNPIIIAGDGVGYDDAAQQLGILAQTVGAPVALQTFSSLANFPNDDIHWQGELPGNQAMLQAVFQQHDVAFLVGWSNQAQVTVFNYADGPLIPPSVDILYLSNNTWDIGKNYYGSHAVLGGIRASLEKLNDVMAGLPVTPEQQQARDARNQHLQQLSQQRRQDWNAYLKQAEETPAACINPALIPHYLSQAITEQGLANQFVYVHEAVSDSPSFQYLMPLNKEMSRPISYYCVSGGSLGWSMPASLGIKIQPTAIQGVTPKLVINAVGDGSSLFYPQVWWSAAKYDLAVLYIITNNREYHTLQNGLEEVIDSYDWEPKKKPVEPDPADPASYHNYEVDYLSLQHPQLNFQQIADAMGAGVQGKIVEQTSDLNTALREAIHFVLNENKPYVLDIRTERDPAAVQQSTHLKSSAKRLRRPSLNYFHKDVLDEINPNHFSTLA
ncbi:thiamine pyrophosphate-binding protein [Photobacterium sp. CCB-ST2H9]|uniref:thiamine pyrophosphate-binding protein n=1 Tax=Photobacterium sp. CCB-ST2H9 TaxID=2912855 RepID=UPI002005C64E|nr:thiamine pyrophosphate-binding protein [Photobacterium sp. CCB-ST2H9]UTM59385.1 thiamine pyrophosphate-binding protein [Photobacterium sp. CCB-ST2H9]